MHSRNSKPRRLIVCTQALIVVHLERCRTVCVCVGESACCQIPGALCLIIVVIFINDRLQRRRYANEIINVSSAIHHHSAGSRSAVEKQAESVCARFSPQAGRRRQERDNRYGRQAIYFYAPWPKYYSGEWRRRCVSIWRKSAFAVAFLDLSSHSLRADTNPRCCLFASLPFIFPPFFAR